MPRFDAKEVLGVNDLMDKKGRIWRAALAEFLGTFFLSFFGCASCNMFMEDEVGGDVVRISLTFGFAIFAGISALGHVSGGHLNPAVTMACLFTGRISLIRALIYFIVQILGCAFGCAMLMVLTPNHPKIARSFGVTFINPYLSPVQGLGVEVILGFTLVMIIFGVCDPHRAPIIIPAPLAIGLAVAMCHLAAIPLTGSSINPARSLGSAIVANIWTDVWVYMTGPTIGGVAAGLLYQHVLKAEILDYRHVRRDTKLRDPK